MKTTLETAIAKFGTYELRHVRDVIQAELIAFAATGAKGTQAHVGKLEMLTAIGAELDTRPAVVPFVDVCHEDGIRGPTVRVF